MKCTSILARLAVSAFCICAAVAAHAQFNQWSYVAHLNEARQAAAASSDINEIFVFGGLSDFANTAMYTAEVYIPSEDTWYQLNNLPFALYGSTAVKIPNSDDIILLGGFDQNGIQQPYYIDYSTIDDDYDWFSVSMPIAGAFPAAAIGNDGNLYVLILNSGTEYLYRRNLTNNTWTYVGAPPSGLGQLPVAVAGGDGLIYFMGGVSGLSFSNAVYSYDAIHDVWTQQPSMNTARAGFGATLGGDKKIYVFGGLTDSFIFTGSMSSAESFKPGDSSWSTIEDLQTARGFVAGATDPLSGKVYAIGGELDGGDTQNQQVLDTAEAFQPPLFSGTGDSFTPTEGTEFSGEVAKFSISSVIPIDYEDSNFTATINWGDGTGNSTGTVSGPLGENFTVSGTHTYSEAGSYLPLVTITNLISGEQIGITAFATVGDATLSATKVDFSASAHVLFTGHVATFTDTNGDGTPGDFTATIDWGDTTSSSGTVTVDPSGGFDVTGSHTYSSVGSEVVKVKITDIDGATATVQDAASVTEPSPSVTGNNLSGVEGAQFSGAVASFTDADSTLGAGSFSATINWGDGASSTGVITSNGVGGFNVSGTHTYEEEGSYTVGVTVNVTGGSAGSNSSVASISDAAITAAGFNLTVKGTNFSGQVASFTDADPHAAVGDFSAHIAWGDGGHSNGTITFSGGAFHVLGTHSYLKKGKYVVTIFVGDVGGSSSTATTKINAGPVK